MRRRKSRGGRVYTGVNLEPQVSGYLDDLAGRMGMSRSWVLNTIVHQYAAFMENTAALIRVDQQVDLFEFALQKMLRRHLEPKFRPVPKPEARYSAVTELAVACSTLLSALAHAGQDTMKEAQAAFERGVKNLNQDGVRFMTQAECTLSAMEAALDNLSEASSPLKKLFLDACAQIVAADGRIQAREAELLRAIADSLDCPIPPFVSVEVGKTRL